MSEAEAVRGFIPYLGGWLGGIMGGGTEPITPERADEMAAEAVEDYIKTCLEE